MGILAIFLFFKLLFVRYHIILYFKIVASRFPLRKSQQIKKNKWTQRQNRVDARKDNGFLHIMRYLI